MFEHPDFNARLFFPRPDSSPPPPGAADEFVDVDGASLHLRIHGGPSAGRGRPLLLFHGNGEVVADYDDLAPRFAAVGFRCCVVDYRGYGRSSGAPAFIDMVEDAPVVLRHVVRKLAEEVVVLGRSLGSACAHALLAAEGVAGVVVDSGFCSLLGLWARRGLKPISPSEQELSRFDPARKAAGATHPVLVVHGAEDRVIGAEEADAFFSALPAAIDKQRVIVEGFGHNDLFFSSSYWGALRAFAERLPR